MRYFVLQENDELGPFDEDELRELSEQGHMQQTSYIRTEDGARSGMLSELLPLIASKVTASEKAAPGPFTMPVPSTATETGSTTDPFLRQDSYTSRQWASDYRSKADESGHDSSEVNINKGTLIGSIVIAAAGLFFFSQRGKWTFFDGVNLIFHEAGHLILGFMPQFIVALAGTLFQLAIPGLLAFYFHRQEKMFATQFCVMWLGQSLLNVSNYIADARARILPLVGGGEHDWTYLLGKIGVLQHDVSIGRILNGVALLIFAAATAWPWLCQWKANLRKTH